MKKHLAAGTFKVAAWQNVSLEKRRVAGWRESFPPFNLFEPEVGRSRVRRGGEKKRRNQSIATEAQRMEQKHLCATPTRRLYSSVKKVAVRATKKKLLLRKRKKNVVKKNRHEDELRVK